ncbi:hypothetical protein PoB_003438600 [Plakobranchus ocellatus]|uniref:Uncharacterized protein n=1 Tax=Plakobranchus ocellatus TaxID=259542 RepID=A0AAV4AHT2_9GAST|nr:hypothetical protein PoB_003438600 [Plakobranchus ocellatus]
MASQMASGMHNVFTSPQVRRPQVDHCPLSQQRSVVDPYLQAALTSQPTLLDQSLAHHSTFSTAYLLAFWISYRGTVTTGSRGCTESITDRALACVYFAVDHIGFAYGLIGISPPPCRHLPGCDALSALYT